MLIFISCSDTLEQPTIEESNSLGFSTLNKKPVRAEDLRVSGLSVARVQKDGLIVGSLSVAPSGSTDFVKIKACDVEETCFETTSASTRTALPPFALGEVFITVTPCVEEERSLSVSNCGISNDTKFLQPNNINIEIQQLLSSKENIISELKKMDKAATSILEQGLKDINSCEKQNEDAAELKALKSTFKGYLALGQALIGESLAAYKRSTATAAKKGSEKPKEGAAEIITPPKVATTAEKGAKIINKTDITPAIKTLEKSFKDLATVDGFSKVAKYGLEKSGLLRVKPIDAMQEIGGLMFDLIKGPAITRKCGIILKASEEQQSVTFKRITLLQNKLKDVDAKISLAKEGGL